MKDNVKISLIVSTYNRPDALSVCLDSVRFQTLMPDEIIIGDDGSKEETKKMIDKLRNEFTIPVIHVWHEDNGFRLAKMRNKSVAKATGDYIIEIDGDIMLSPHFIADHMRLAKKGYYVKGGRVNLNKKLSDAICKTERSRSVNFFTKGIESKRENSLHLTLLSLYLAPRYRKNSSAALGCNMSFWKEDFIKINGYDETFEGWGCEDYDLANRLQRSGLQKRYLKFAGIVYHLWHEDKHMYNFENNQAYERVQNEKQVVRCDKGIDQYL